MKKKMLAPPKLEGVTLQENSLSELALRKDEAYESMSLSGTEAEYPTGDGK